MLDRINSAVVAVILGFLVWLYARSRDQESIDHYPIPVHIKLAAGQSDHHDLEVTGPARVMASFSGPPSRIRELRDRLQQGRLCVQVVYSVPEDREKESRFLDTIRVDAADIHAPPGVRAMVAEGQNRIPVTLRRIVERRLPVQLDAVHEDRLSQAVLEPSAVMVRGPQEILERIRSIPTQLYTRPPPPDADLVKNSNSTGTVRLVTELEGRPIQTNPPVVSLRLTYRATQKVYELLDVPVRFLCPAGLPHRPQWEDERNSKISLRLLGPAGAESPQVIAYIDLTVRKFEPGLYADEIFRLQLPEGFQLADSPPRSGAFRLVPVRETGQPSPGVGVRKP